ncbi:MAG TPA: glutamate synthase large subunit [Candidatus Dormibacteraeota bacterium]|nr:glutamate synthase large subunit [Candidatus Dormibacteraeota bacterium]
MDLVQLGGMLVGWLRARWSTFGVLRLGGRPSGQVAFRPQMPTSAASVSGAWPGQLPEHRAACGMGFVATPGTRATHRTVQLGLTALARLSHRGGLDADGRSGDGAGLLVQVPRALFGPDVAVAVLFEWDDRARRELATALAGYGMGIADWRRPPLDPDSLGERARERMPGIWHAVITRPDVPDDEWERLLYFARRLAERRAGARGIRMYIASCSCRTMVYKGLMAGTYLADFYADLRDERMASQLAVFHQRYSTNTLPDWRLAQPFRMLAHNGEINTVTGNRAWMRAREAELPEGLRPVAAADASDSASLDSVLELLVRRGFDTGEALMTLVPDAWEGRGDMAPRVRDFYRFQSTRFEPWDGPAALAFSDGIVAGAALDRNGLRPLRYQVARDGMVVAASEAGVIPVDPADVVERGRLGPGQLILVDVREGVTYRDHEAKEHVASRHDYGLLADRVLVPVERGHLPAEVPEHLARLQRMHGWGAEDVRMVLQEMADTGLEPNYSMGDDIPIASFARVPRRLTNHLRQRFAQVTNPAIDSLRERSVMSLRVVLGARGRTLGPENQAGAELGRRQHPATIGHDHPLLELESPVLGRGELARVLESALVLDACLGPGEDLRGAIERLCQEAEQAPPGIVALSDRRAGPRRLPLPTVLAAGAVHERLLRSGQRMQKDIVVVAGDVIDVHDLACLVTTGASAVHPYLALATAHLHGGDDGERLYRHALEHGLLKVMAKMGISCVSSYCGAQVYEVLGLGAEVMELCLPAAPSRIGGATLSDLEGRLRAWHRHAWEPADEPTGRDALADHGRVRFRKAGEFHAYNPLAVRAAQKAARTGDPDEYRRWLELSTMGPPQDLRDLLEIRPAAGPVPLDEVEPATEIRRRFVSTAMSLGALSPEAHAALAIAMNEIGARSNSGEGGEDPDFYAPAEVRRDNKIKQVASARFGVTPGYLRRAEELEIKIAQGSKPGEGGQLPGLKVTSLIARLRHAQAGQPLISPPPHHDIYSIEDLAQLIYDLKAANPAARVGVKLVSEAGVGTIAAGVVKARADYVLVSGHSGGTGASPLSSIKSAGSPWELGLAETQQVLVDHRLRERVSLRTDGGLRSGRDVVVAAMLGAEEFGFGTGLLVALGCDMARQCHLNTCPTGIATQREDLRAKFTGDPEHVVAYLTLIAEDARRYLALAGVRSIDEVVGRVEQLHAAGEDHGLDLGFLLQAPADPAAPRRRLWARNGEPPPPAPPPGPIGNSHRAVGPGLRAQSVVYRGSAGQSFGAWLDRGTELVLEGEANDYVGKGMGGGVLVVRPFEGDGSTSGGVAPVLVGNTCLYGATGGRVFVAGRAGERFCVRNSGATAVLEGAGDHFCEYMTGGIAVALGPVGWNVGAGMTGGVAYVREWGQLNADSVTLQPVQAEDEPELRALVEEHARRTGSRRAACLLADWPQALSGFRKVVPLIVTAARPAEAGAPGGEAAAEEETAARR